MSSSRRYAPSSNNNYSMSPAVAQDPVFAQYTHQLVENGFDSVDVLVVLREEQLDAMFQVCHITKIGHQFYIRNWIASHGGLAATQEQSSPSRSGVLLIEERPNGSLASAGLKDGGTASTKDAVPSPKRVHSPAASPIRRLRAQHTQQQHQAAAAAVVHQPVSPIVSEPLVSHRTTEFARQSPVLSVSRRGQLLMPESDTESLATAKNSGTPRRPRAQLHQSPSRQLLLNSPADEESDSGLVDDRTRADAVDASVLFDPGERVASTEHEEPNVVDSSKPIGTPNKKLSERQQSAKGFIKTIRNAAPGSSRLKNVSQVRSSVQAASKTNKTPVHAKRPKVAPMSPKMVPGSQRHEPAVLTPAPKPTPQVPRPQPSAASSSVTTPKPESHPGQTNTVQEPHATEPYQKLIAMLHSNTPEPSVAGVNPLQSTISDGSPRIRRRTTAPLSPPDDAVVAQSPRLMDRIRSGLHPTAAISSLHSSAAYSPTGNVGRTAAGNPYETADTVMSPPGKVSVPAPSSGHLQTVPPGGSAKEESFSVLSFSLEQPPTYQDPSMLMGPSTPMLATSPSRLRIS